MTFTQRYGAATVHQVTEIAVWPFAPRDLFPAITDEQVRDAADTSLPGLVSEDGDLVLAVHTYVVELGGTVVLVDCGNGNGRDRPHLLPHHDLSNDYSGGLAAAGVAVDDVDLVISTHLHPDHSGWATREDVAGWTPTFGRATYLFGRQELAVAQSLKASAPTDGVPADLVRSFDDSVAPVLATAPWDVVDDGHVLAEHDGTRAVVRTAPGHTAGHLVVEIVTPTGGAVISGDVIHHPVQLLHPDLVQSGDADPVVARATRDHLLARCAADGTDLLTAHFAIDAPTRLQTTAAGRVVAPSVLR